MVKMVSFNLPSPYQAELAKIADQQRMAEMLQAQSQAPIERYSYKGIEARTPATAGLAKLLQGFGGAYFQGQAREQEKALGEKYRAEQSADFTNLAKMLSAPAVAGSAAVPERLAAPPTMPVDDEGNPMPGVSAAPAVPAVAARRAGQIDPEMIGKFKTPETQQMAMAQLLAQIGPKAPIKASAGDVFFSPEGKELFRAPDKEEYGTTPQIEKNKDSPTGYVAVVYSKNGTRKVIGPADPVNQFTTGTVDAALKRDMEMYQFGNLSAEQKASLGIRLTQAGVDVARLNAEFGQGPARQPALPTNAPAPNFGTQTLPPAGAGQPTQLVAPVAVPTAPRIGMAPRSVPAPTMNAEPGAVPLPLKARIEIEKESQIKKNEAQRVAASELPTTISNADLAISTIDQMIGTEGKKLNPGEIFQPPHPGFTKLVGAPIMSQTRRIAGTDAANFEAYLDQVKGGAFLQAFERLKGGGQITEVEGSKATAAITRMSAAQSPKEFIIAAREYQDILRSGVERAKQKASGSVGVPGAVPLQPFQGQNRQTPDANVIQYNEQGIKQ